MAYMGTLINLHLSVVITLLLFVPGIATEQMVYMGTLINLSVVITLLLLVPGIASEPQCTAIPLLAEAESKSIASTFSNYLYRNLNHCVLHISTASDYHGVTLTFHDRTWSNETKPWCQDRVRIYDGPTTNYSRIEIPCEAPTQPLYNFLKSFASRASDMTIVFTSMTYLSLVDYSFSYKSYLRPVPRRGVVLLAGDTANYLSSPNYPLDYSSNVGCRWYITTGSSSSVVLLTVVTFSVEGSRPICGNDSVTVFDGPSIFSPRMQLMCGEVSSGLFRSSTSDLTIMFHSNEVNNYRGFEFEYVAVAKNDIIVGNSSDADVLAIISAAFICILFALVVAYLPIRLLLIKRNTTTDRTKISVTESSQKIKWTSAGPPPSPRQWHYFGTHKWASSPPPYSSLSLHAGGNTPDYNPSVVMPGCGVATTWANEVTSTSTGQEVTANTAALGLPAYSSLFCHTSFNALAYASRTPDHDRDKQTSRLSVLASATDSDL